MKYDERDGKFKVFEVNVRQVRSSYYMTQCGHNMAKYFVDDLIHNKNKELTYLSCEQVFSVVPKGVLKKYVSNKNFIFSFCAKRNFQFIDSFEIIDDYE